MKGAAPGAAVPRGVADSGGPGPAGLERSGAGLSSALRALFLLSRLEFLIILAFAAYCAIFIYETSFVISGTRYFCLFDDEMISMRYAANLAHGYGLVWNPGGEKVAGFTNLLWVLYMSVFHRLPVSAARISLLIQVSGAAFIAATLLFVRSIARQLFPARPSAATVSMALVAFYGPLLNWSLQGSEVSLLTLFVCASVWLSLRSIENESTTIELYGLLGIATICRLDMAVFAGSILIALSLAQPRRWKHHLLVGGSIVGLFLATQLAFNYGYYGDALPNTYYLKMTGYPLLRRLHRGLSVAGTFAFPLIPLIVAVAVAESYFNRRRRHVILVVPVLVQVAYSIWVGGDAWEDWGGANRYIAPVMPLFYILLAGDFAFYASWMGGWVERMWPRREAATNLALACSVVFALALSNRQHFLARALIQKPLQTAQPQSEECNEDMVRQALAVRSLTDKSATIAVVWAGAIPYFAGRRAIDLLGKNDSKIAREPMKVGSQFERRWGFYPGHLKWDYDYSIGQLRPDLIVQIWGVDPERLPCLKSYTALTAQGFHWYVRRDSPHVSGRLSD